MPRTSAEGISLWKAPRETLGVVLARLRARREAHEFGIKELAPPGEEMMERARSYFSNSFPITAGCHMDRQDIEGKLKEYYWHYPFQFGDLLVDSSHDGWGGLHGNHYRRYLHVFPNLLSLTGGSLRGYSVLDVGCNAGYWALQARLAGADRVVGIEASPKNVEQANFILRLIGLDGIEYRVMRVGEMSREVLGEFDISFFMGLLYHLDKPLDALGLLHDATRRFAVVDTRLFRAGGPVALLKKDRVHDQNFSNGVSWLPSRAAVALMLHYVGFRDVYQVPSTPSDLAGYLKGDQATFIAVR